MLYAEVEAVRDCREPNSSVPPGQGGPCRSAPQPYPLFLSQRNATQALNHRWPSHISLSRPGRRPTLSPAIHHPHTFGSKTSRTALGQPPGQGNKDANVPLSQCYPRCPSAPPAWAAFSHFLEPRHFLVRNRSNAKEQEARPMRALLLPARGPGAR